MKLLLDIPNIVSEPKRPTISEIKPKIIGVNNTKNFVFFLSKNNPLSTKK